MRSACFALLFAFVCLVAPQSFANNTGGLLTMKLINGHAWVGGGDGFRQNYLLGYVEALRLFAPRSDEGMKLHKSNYSVNELKEAVSKFYSLNPAYARIPISAAISFTLDRALGASQATVIQKADAALVVINEQP